MANAVKEQFIDELTSELKTSEHVLVTDYQGLTTEELIELRSKLRGAKSKYKVVKNRLAKIAFKNVGWEGMDDVMKGPSAIVFQGDDSSEITKILSNFGKDHKSLKIKGGFLFGEVADSKKIDEIASLPSREVLLATLLATMQSPLQNLASALNEPLTALVRAMNGLAKKKEQAGAA